MDLKKLGRANYLDDSIRDLTKLREVLEASGDKRITLLMEDELEKGLGAIISIPPKSEIGQMFIKDITALIESYKKEFDAL